MASPQKENGYTPIANEILEALAKTKLTGQEFRVLMHIFRQTYGYSRKEYTASLSTIGQAIDMNRIVVKKMIDKLLPRKVICVTAEGNKALTYRINKNYEEWVLPPRVTVGVTAEGNKIVTYEGNTKEVLPIIRKQKTKNIKKSPSKRTADFHSFFWPIYPKKKDKAAALKKWESLAKSGVLPPTENVIASVKAEIEEKKTLRFENKFCPEWKNPSTWLNKGCWDDDHTIPCEPKKEKKWADV
jgi:phage replication O-like protein O